MKKRKVEVVTLNKSNENPFYGLRNCLKIMQFATGDIEERDLDAAYTEIQDSENGRKMFYSLLFSIGDITARQHNIFKGIKKDSGGNSNREGFYTIFMWLKERHPEQFYKFLHAGLFNEYTCFDFLFRSRVKTHKGRVIKVYDVFSDKRYRTELATFVYSIVKGTNPFNKQLVAKFLSLPRLSKRPKHKKMMPETKSVMENKAMFLKELSILLGWNYNITPTISNFEGYRRWRKDYNGDLESVLFSTGKIKEFKKQEFLEWFDRLPANARLRTKNKILYSENSEGQPKYSELIKWYQEWEDLKLEKQKEQRVLEEKIRQGQATEEDKEKLAKVKKQAKVNTGAVSFKDIYKQVCEGEVDELRLESFIQNKVNLPYNNLVIVDDSGSMCGEPFNFATFIATVCLVKNPDDDARNLLGFFDSDSHWHSYMDSEAKNIVPNNLWKRVISKCAPKPFVDPKMSFIDNYRAIREFMYSVFRSGYTNISSIPEGLHEACKKNPEILDAVRSYPVWTIISDGEWNNLPSPEASMSDFMKKCENWFGFRPFIVAIDVPYYGACNFKADRFSGIDNFMYVPANPSSIEQFLTNFKDMDVFDAYTPLQSLFRSNRYELIRENTL